MDYEKIRDSDLIELAQKGDSFALETIMERYKNLVKSRARAFFIIGADGEDVIQEGMIGLFKAIKDFKDEKNASFITYASLCINRQILNALKTASRKKHMPLNDSMSLDMEDSANIFWLDKKNPEDLVILKEEEIAFRKSLEEALSSFEKKVVNFYLEGLSRKEIALRLEKTEKSVGNAIQRIRKKTGEI